MGEVVVAPLSGLAMVIFEAKAACAKTAPASAARTKRPRRRRSDDWRKERYFFWIDSMYFSCRGFMSHIAFCLGFAVQGYGSNAMAPRGTPRAGPAPQVWCGWRECE